jgi:hypothetical protein
VGLLEPVLILLREKSLALNGIQIPYRSVRSLVTTAITLSLSLEFIYAFFINIDAPQSTRLISYRIHYRSQTNRVSDVCLRDT